MVKNILINGDSFLTTRGSCQTTVGLELAKKFNLNVIFPPFGLAKGGRGNDRIVNTTKLAFYRYPKLIKKTLVLIGWSHTVRNDYLIDALHEEVSKYSHKREFEGMGGWGTQKATKGKHKDGLPGNYCLKKNLRLRHLSHILSLQDFFNLHGIKYCMYNALANNYFKKHSALDCLSGQVNKNAFFEFENPISHLKFVSEDTDNTGCQLVRGPKDDHPNELGCKLWADKLEVFIKENDLL